MSSVAESLPAALMEELTLPEDLISHILSRLPVKSLARFRSVCKTWNSVISSPEFSAQHISATASASYSLLTLSKIYEFPLDDDPVYDLYYPPFDAENCSRRLETPPNPEGYGSLPVGVVHGVVCIFRLVYSEKAVILWNPIIGKHISFPIAEDLTVEGFGYDSVTKQLKVLASRSNHDSSMVEFEVVSDRDRQWRKLTGVHCYHLGARKGVVYEHLYHQGCIHWLRYDELWFLVVFDCTEEEFRTMDLTDELAKCKSLKEFGWGPFNAESSDSKELIVTQCGAGFSVYHIMKHSMGRDIDIWGVMNYGEEASSWVKMFALPLRFDAVDVKVLVDAPTISMWLISVKSLVVCDVIGKNIKRIFEHPNLVFSTKIFQESLLLLDA